MSEEGRSGGRGRARSRTYSSDDQHFLDELSTAAGLPSVAAAPSAAPPPRAAAASGGVSQRTIKTLTNLDAALGKAESGGEEDDYGSSAAAAPTQRRNEAEEAEAELVEQERRRRAGELVGGSSSGVGSGGSSGSSTSSSSSSSNSNSSSSSSSSSSGSSAAAAAALAGVHSVGTGSSGAVGAAGGSGGRRSKAAEAQSYDVQVKLLLLGDSGVGKTSLMMRFSEDKFSPTMLSTAGVDYKTAYLDVEGKRVKCQIWDTAGQQRFHVITHSYYKNAQGIVLVYDVSESSEASFNNVQYWMENIQKHANPATRKLLIGNKIDAKGSKIASERGRAVAEQFGMRFIETSAFDGTNVKEAFSGLARDVVESMIASGLLAGGAGGAAAAGSSAAAAGKAAAGAAGKKDCVIM